MSNSKKPNIESFKDRPGEHHSSEFIEGLTYFAEYAIKKYSKVSHDELEDFVQSLLLRVFERLVRRPYDPGFGTSFTSYIHSILRNGVSNYLYHQSKAVEPVDVNTVREEVATDYSQESQIYSVFDFPHRLAALFEIDISNVRRQLSKCIQLKEFDTTYFQDLPLMSQSIIKVVFWKYFTDKDIKF